MIVIKPNNVNVVTVMENQIPGSKDIDLSAIRRAPHANRIATPLKAQMRRVLEVLDKTPAKGIGV